jgi:hypothetical protein
LSAYLSWLAVVISLLLFMMVALIQAQPSNAEPLNFLRLKTVAQSFEYSNELNQHPLLT